MDDRTLDRAMIGAFLVTSSAMRAERNAGRAMSIKMVHELSALGDRWRNRATQAGALGTGALGLAVLVLAYRASARAETRENTTDVLAPTRPPLPG